MLTLEDEVDLIWHQELTIASLIFILNRVATGLMIVATVLATFNPVSS